MIDLLVVHFAEQTHQLISYVMSFTIDEVITKHWLVEYVIDDNLQINEFISSFNRSSSID